MNIVDRARDGMIDLYTDVAIQAKANPKANKKSFAVGAAIGVVISSMHVAFATQDVTTFGNSIVNIIANIYDQAFAIVTVLAALLAVAAFIVRMSGNPQRAAQATQWLVRIAIAYVGINSIGVIMKVIRGTVPAGAEFDPRNPNG